MIIFTLLFIQIQTYRLPALLENPSASWSDWTGDSQPEIWVHDSKHHFIIDPEGAVHALKFDGSPQSVFPFYWQGRWYAGTLLQDSVCVFRENNWSPVIQFPGTHFRSPDQVETLNGYLVLPVLKGYELMQQQCPAGILSLRPSLHLGRKYMEIQFPGLGARDINHDKFQDFQSPPTVNESTGSLQINSFLCQNGFWSPLLAEMMFPRDKEIQNWAMGCLDEDAYPELVLLTAQPRGGSIFGEMELMIYRGEGPGKWSKLPLQTITTGQNIWQNGPINISPEGIRLFYYKGLIRSHFRMDLYPAMGSAIVEPRAKSGGWKMKDADRSIMINQFDLNGNGYPDLLLSDERGFVLYPGNKENTFEERSGYVTGPAENDATLEISIGGNGINMSLLDQKNIVRGNGRTTMLFLKESLQFWTLKRDETGDWLLTRQDMNWHR